LPTPCGLAINPSYHTTTAGHTRSRSHTHTPLRRSILRLGATWACALCTLSACAARAENPPAELQCQCLAAARVRSVPGAGPTLHAAASETVILPCPWERTSNQMPVRRGTAARARTSRVSTPQKQPHTCTLENNRRLAHTHTHTTSKHSMSQAANRRGRAVGPPLPARAGVPEERAYAARSARAP